ncbi:hypothetical protein Tco_1327276 [Tanacetum coccineum]
MPTEMELTLEQTQQGVSYEVSVLSDIEDSHGPSDAKHKPLPATERLCFKTHGDTLISIDFLTPNTFKSPSAYPCDFARTSESLISQRNGNPLESNTKQSQAVDPHDPMDFQPTWRMTNYYSPPRFIANCFMQAMQNGDGDFRYSDTTHLSRSVKFKVKNFKKDATLKLFKNGMSMLVQKSQVHKMAKLQVGMEIMLG